MSSILDRLRKKDNKRIVIRAKLFAKHVRGEKETDLGLVSDKVVTDVFVAYVVDAMQDSTTYPMDVFKYHDSGTGTTGPVAGNTVLETPTGEARDTGTTIEGASANIYKTVATNTYAGTFAITEHGVFSAASAGTLLDRSTFTAINVVSSDQIEFTYELTFTAGG